MVCTLGNFALKLLTRSNTGITRVHGEPQEHELGRAARSSCIRSSIPAAALRGAGVLEQLREDFASCRRCSAEPEPEPEPRPGPPRGRTPPRQMDLFG